MRPVLSVQKPRILLKLPFPANVRESPHALIGGSLELANPAGRAKLNAVATLQFVGNAEN